MALDSTRLPLRRPFLAVQFVNDDKTGRSSLAPMRHLCRTCRTAWLVHHKLMAAMAEWDALQPLAGDVGEARCGCSLCPRGHPQLGPGQLAVRRRCSQPRLAQCSLTAHGWFHAWAGRCLEHSHPDLHLVRQVTALTGFTHSAGVEVESAEPGSVELELPRKPELLQFNGYFHGGVISGLADHAAGAAATTALPAGKIAITVDLHVNFLAPANGATMVAKAHTLQIGTTLCVVAISVETETAQGPQVCAVASAVLRVVDMPAFASAKP